MIHKEWDSDAGIFIYYDDWGHIIPEPEKPKVFRSQASIPGKHQLTEDEQRVGASKGGQIRAYRLSPERRREIAQKAAQKRWKRKGKAT